MHGNNEALSCRLNLPIHLTQERRHALALPAPAAQHLHLAVDTFLQRLLLFSGGGKACGDLFKLFISRLDNRCTHDVHSSWFMLREKYRKSDQSVDTLTNSEYCNKK